MKKLLLSLLVLSSSLLALKAQIINTIAGNDSAGFNGDGGPASAAELYGPTGVFVDKTGNIYVTDRLNNRIRLINTLGIISTVAGNGYGVAGIGGYSGDGGQATDAELGDPGGVCLDKEGNIYITEAWNNRIRKVSTSGIINTIAGNGRGGFSGDGGMATNAEIWGPAKSCVDTFGNLYIGDESNYRVRKVNTSGIITTIAGGGTQYPGNGGPATAASLGGIIGISVTDSGTIYFAIYDQDRVCKVNTSGIMYTIAGNGISGFSGDGGPATNAELNTPLGLYTDRFNNVIFCDGSNNRVRIVSPYGIISTLIGNGIEGFSGDGGPATDAEVNIVEDVFEDNTGNAYIADCQNNRIREVTGLNISTGIDNVNNCSFTIYPNPSSQFLYLNISGTQIKCGVIKIIDMFGKEVLEFNSSTDLSQTLVKLNISSLADGAYFINISGNNYSYTQKFIKI